MLALFARGAAHKPSQARFDTRLPRKAGAGFECGTPAGKHESRPSQLAEAPAGARLTLSRPLAPEATYASRVSTSLLV